MVITPTSLPDWISRILVTTVDVLQGYVIDRYYSTRVHTLSFLPTIFNDAQKFSDHIEECYQLLREDAIQLDANAVIGVAFNYHKTAYGVAVTVMGTPVIAHEERDSNFDLNTYINHCEQLKYNAIAPETGGMSQSVWEAFHGQNREN